MSLSTEVKKLLQNTDAIWEALSADGVVYPFDDSRYCKTEKQREKIAEKVKVFDEERALAIANLILLNDELKDNGGYFGRLESDAALGAIVRRQVIGHMKRIEEFGQ